MSRVLIEWIGYDAYVRSGDAILSICSFILGVLFMSLLSGNFIRQLYHVEDFGHKSIKMIRVSNGTKSKYMVHLTSFWEAVQQVLLLSFSQFFTVKHYTYRDERRTKIFLIIMTIVFVILIYTCIDLIYTVELPVDPS